MIHAVRCDDPRFKQVEFTPGFNVVLADRTKESTRKGTRNGLGKTTLLEIFHFCLGASTKRGVGLVAEPLMGWTFTLELDLEGEPVAVSRQTSSPAQVLIEGDVSEWLVQPRRTTTDTQEMLITEWCQLLGARMFGLPPEAGTSPYSPTFRGLVSYFIRRGRDAYATPFEHHRKQSEADKQVYNAFLLGLDWTYARDWQVLKDKKRLLEDLRRTAQVGLVNTVLGSVGELEAFRIRLEARAREEEDQLRSFRVHPQYQALEARANILTLEIHELSNRNFSDSQLVSLYEASMQYEKEPTSEDVTRVYEEAGVALPELVRKRLADVQAFHRSVIENRKQFLATEVDRLHRAIMQRRDLIHEKDSERASLMEILQTHGALEEYTRLQQLHTETVAQVRDIEQRLSNLRTFEQGRSDLAIEQALLQRRARQDLEERDWQRSKAIALFNENSEFLYNAPGNLVIDIEPTGYRFNVEIERSGSQGIDTMKVFCYDLMLAQLWAERKPSPGFLVHDSTVFDGVDERQIALALELAERESRTRGFQYICTLNSDTIPWNDFSSGFDLNRYVRLRLTDETEDGCLLGIRF